MGTRRVTRAAAVLAGLALALPVFAALAVAAAVYGSIGAATAALLLRSGLGARVSLSLVGIGCALLAAVAGRHLLRDGPAAHAATETAAHAPSHGAHASSGSVPPAAVRGAAILRDGPLLALGALAFCGLFGEGAMADWSALLLERTTGAAPAAAALGYAAFSVAMTAGRLAGDAVVARAGGARTLRASGLLAAAGLALALLAPYGPALVGCAVVGLGYANLVPVLFSASGRRAGSTGVAAVSTLGYSGFVVGPPVIGRLAQAAGSLPAALAVVAVLGLVIAVGAGVVGRAATVAAGARPAVPSDEVPLNDVPSLDGPPRAPALSTR